MRHSLLGLVVLASLSGCGSSAVTSTGSGGTTTGAPGGSGGAAGSGGDSGGSGGATGGSGGATGGSGGATGGTTGTGGAVQCDDYSAYKNLYWGELHQHTSYSLDAYSFGDRSDPASAYAFAKGKGSIPIAQGSMSPGPVVTLARPLDFLAVTDHSEWMSVTDTCVLDSASADYDSTYCKAVRSTNGAVQSTVFASLPNKADAYCGAGPGCPPQEDAWTREIKAAKEAYEECHFTSIVAYEWTDTQPPPGGAMKTANDHRNVFFNNDASVPGRPFDSAQYDTPPKLWQALEDGCKGDCEALTIPHNTNESEGVSLKVWDPTPAGVALQRKYQVAAEIYQHKGASECMPGGADAACGFEDAAKTPVPMSYVRTALGSGIAHAEQHPLQGNPLELGLVGATDDHNATPGNVDEATWPGHAGRTDDTADRRLSDAPKFGPGGITGVWAPQNTRAEIFAAIKRRETFATSGPRIRVRFYQTTDSTACADPSFPKAIVDAGANPMGSTVAPAALGGKAPSFAIQVWPDASPQKLADGTTGPAKIASVQIIKLAVDAAGNAVESAPQEVAGIPATGGCAVWTDASFDAGHRAVYYVRALQEPTYRWSKIDCAAAASPPAGCSDGTLNADVQERAWTSPIWYTP
jgi:hypothetical protein